MRSDQIPSCLGILWGFYYALFIHIHHHDPHQPTNGLTLTPKFLRRKDCEEPIARLDTLGADVRRIDPSSCRIGWGRLTLEPMDGTIEKGQFLKQKKSGTAVPEWDFIWSFWKPGCLWSQCIFLTINLDTGNSSREYWFVSPFPFFLFCFFSFFAPSKSNHWLVGWLVGQLVDSRPWRLETF